MKGVVLITLEEFERKVDAGIIYKAGNEWIEVEDPIIDEEISPDGNKFSDLIEFD